VIEIRNPGVLAASIEIDLVRFRGAGTMLRMPFALTELARTLGKVAAMLRQAEARGQAVDLGHEVVRAIQQFRNALAAVGGAPAEA
jgi:type VI protein secretion system component VasF